MTPVKLLWNERQSDSPFVVSVWTCHALEATSRAIIADPCICISLVRNNARTEVLIAGPKTRPRLQALPAGYMCTTLRLKPGVALKGIHASELINDMISVPADDEARFRLNDQLFQFSDFEHAEQLVDDLFVAGYLSFKEPQDGALRPRRTYSRQTRRLTGISPYKLHQLQRMHQALRLLKDGATTADVVAELDFTDQAHFTHASKQFFGYTPKQLEKLLQNP